MVEVRLTYRREGDKLFGNIDGADFNGLTYAQMMTQAHKALTAKPEAQLEIVRTDRPGLLPVILEPPLLQLLREDPVGFIRANSVLAENVQGLQGAARPVSLPRSVTVLRVGVATLSMAFGEYIYLRMQGSRVEHPCSGRYEQLSVFVSWLGSGYIRLFRDEELLQWAEVRTEDLLRTDTTRLYLPCAWNSSGGWISRQGLQEKYNQFVQERDKCLLEIEQSTQDCPE